MSADLETVFVPRDPAELAYVQATLDEAGIPYATANLEVQNLFGAGQIGGVNIATGPIEIQVATENARRARELLRLPAEFEDLDANVIDSDDSARPHDAPARNDEANAARLARISLVWAVLWLGGLGSMLAVYFGVRAIRLTNDQSGPARWKAFLGVVLGAVGIVLWALTWGGSLWR